METPELSMLQSISVPAEIKLALSVIARSRGTSMRALSARVIEDFVRTELDKLGGSIKIELSAQQPA